MPLRLVLPPNETGRHLCGLRCHSSGEREQEKIGGALPEQSADGN
jgi:hypothetical protein